MKLLLLTANEFTKIFKRRGLMFFFVLVILNCFLAGLNVYESYTTAGGNFSLENWTITGKAPSHIKTNCSNTNPNCLPPTKAPSPGRPAPTRVKREAPTTRPTTSFGSR